MVSSIRVQDANDAPIHDDRDYVLAWLVAERRTHHSFTLDRALEHARELGKPLLVFEALRIGYRWASDRMHAFILEGMVDNAARCEEAGVTYVSYVEPEVDADKGLLAALASRACVVVTDEWPCFFVPRMIASASEALDVRLETVDNNGLLPLRAHEREFTVAHSYRRHLQKTVPDHLDDMPAADPFDGYDLGAAEVPDLSDWPCPTPEELLDGGLADLDIDHDVPRAPLRGGPVAGRELIQAFLDDKLERYADGRNHPDDDASSGLSPYLHFGHVGSHEVFAAIVDHEGWNPGDLAPKANGKREGWWGMSEGAEAFLDELVTWREIGHGFCFQRPDDYDDFDSLPDWALTTLSDHEDDPREYTYTLDELERADTHDEIWNAAQTQLREEGRIHNYLRMLWGKKVLHWSPTPREALERLEHLNNRWALDGRDPNSYSGIFWTFGRFDRAWGPERPIFGKVRYMTSDSTRRKLRITPYLERWSG